MFVDYKLEAACFGNFGHHQVFSKITYGHATYGVSARGVDGQICASRHVVSSL